MGGGRGRPHGGGVLWRDAELTTLGSPSKRWPLRANFEHAQQIGGAVELVASMGTKQAMVAVVAL